MATVNYHKNDENNLTSKYLKGVHMNFFESLGSFLEGHKERMMHKFLACLRTRQSRGGFYKRFSGRSKTFKKNRRRGL